MLNNEHKYSCKCSKYHRTAGYYQKHSMLKQKPRSNTNCALQGKEYIHLLALLEPTVDYAKRNRTRINVQQSRKQQRQAKKDRSCNLQPKIRKIDRTLTSKNKKRRCWNQSVAYFSEKNACWPAPKFQANQLRVIDKSVDTNVSCYKEQEIREATSTTNHSIKSEAVVSLADQLQVCGSADQTKIEAHHDNVVARVTGRNRKDITEQNLEMVSPEGDIVDLPVSKLTIALAEQLQTDDSQKIVAATVNCMGEKNVEKQDLATVTCLKGVAAIGLSFAKSDMMIFDADNMPRSKISGKPTLNSIIAASSETTKKTLLAESEIKCLVFRNISIDYTDEINLIVSCIANKQSLLSVTFDRCDIGVTRAGKIFDALRNKGITHVSLDGNNIGSKPEGAEGLAKLIEENRTITIISLRDCKIDNAGAGLLVNALIKNNSIINIDLENNNICANLTRDIQFLLWKNRQWQGQDMVQIGQGRGVLDLSKNTLNFSVIKNFLIDLFNKRGIDCLDLSNRQLKRDAVQALCDFIRGTSVTQINLRNNSLTYADALKLVEASKSKRTLKTLDLACNCISIDGEKAISALVVAVQAVDMQINVYCNGIGYTGVASLTQSTFGSNISFFRSPSSAVSTMFKDRHLNTRNNDLVSVSSRIDPTIEISNKKWLVCIVRRDNVEHVKILIEGIDDCFSQRFIEEAQLLVKPVNKPWIRVQFYDLDMLDLSTFTVKVWQRDRKLVESMRASIYQDVQQPPPDYNKWSNNCFHWAIAKVKVADITDVRNYWIPSLSLAMCKKS